MSWSITEIINIANKIEKINLITKLEVVKNLKFKMRRSGKPKIDKRKLKTENVKKILLLSLRKKSLSSIK